METLTQPGYKSTELGWIPEEWEVKTYDEIFGFLATATYSRAELSDNQEVGYVHYGDIHTKYDFHLDVSNSNLPSITKEKVKSYSILQDGDLIMADASEDYDGVGKSVEIKNVGNRKIISGLHTFLLRDKQKRIADGFKGYLHSNPIIKKQFNNYATGMKVYGVSKNNLKKIFIPLPPLPEQQAIARALSDMDGYIHALEQLIEKKKAIKQAAMQELLTPKEDWEVRKLGELGKIKKGKGIKKDEVLESGFPCVRYGELYTSFDFVVGETVSFINNDSAINSVKITKGDILFAGSGETKEEIGKCATFLQEEGFAGGDIIILTPIKSDPLFLGYLLNTKEVVKQKTRMGQGDAVVHIYPSAISEIIVSLPKSINVQKEIGMLIRSFEEDILLLELNLKKCFLIKQAMIQGLLTGRVRLV